MCSQAANAPSIRRRRSDCLTPLKALPDPTNRKIQRLTKIKIKTHPTNVEITVKSPGATGQTLAQYVRKTMPTTPKARANEDRAGFLIIISGAQSSDDDFLSQESDPLFLERSLGLDTTDPIRRLLQLLSDPVPQFNFSPAMLSHRHQAAFSYGALKSREI